MDGKMYPMEIHLVHWNNKYGDVATALGKSDGLAVLGFFYEVGCYLHIVLYQYISSSDCLDGQP